jgi:acyl-CoA oxidase
MPGSVHIAMFIRVIEIMGTKTQKETYLKKCASMEIVGCYAQTELGHGSDVQGL